MTYIVEIKATEGSIQKHPRQPEAEVAVIRRILVSAEVPFVTEHSLVDMIYD